MIAEYGDGGRKGFIVIPKGVNGKGLMFSETLKDLGSLKSPFLSPITEEGWIMV